MNSAKIYFDHEKLVAYLECAACLDVLAAKGKCTVAQIQEGQAILHETVSLVTGLIKSFSPGLLGEASLPYQTSSEI